jgi:hypothetical protein
VGTAQLNSPPDQKPHTKIEYEMCDLYAVGGSGLASEDGMAERLFVHEVQLLGSKGEIVRVCAVFDDGTMICMMCSHIYKKIKHRLQGWKPSKHVLCMVNGTLVKSQATWTGKVRLGSIQVEGTIEVFNSSRGWSFLFGKPMLWVFKANHDYEWDTIQVRDSQSVTKLRNQIDSKYYMKHASGEMSMVTDWKQGGKDPLLAVSDEGKQLELGPEWLEVLTEDLEGATSTFTRQQDLFSQSRVDVVLKAIEISDDMTAEQREAVCNLIAKYADCFALSIREVIPAKDTTLRLNIPEEAQLPMKTCQHTFTPPQRRYLHKKILEMLEAGIIEQANLSKIKCMSQTMLGQKQHKGAGLMLEELQH